MNDDTVPRSFLILVLVVLGGFFAGAETAFSNCSRVRVKSKAEDGDPKARRIEKILAQFDKALVTLLIGTNVVHVLATSSATILALRWFGSYGSLISTVVMTLIIFIFSETIPKNIAKANSERFAAAVSGVIYVLMVLLTPIAACFTGLSNGLKKLFSPRETEPSMTEDDFKSMLETIEDEGGLESKESELIQSALKFSDIAASRILTPRVRITGINRQEKAEICQEKIIQTQFSRLPVFDGDIDHVVGILNVKAYLFRLFKTGTCRIDSAMSEPYFVQANTDVYSLFQEMCKRKQHMAVVLDDWGGTLGLVTMEDILELLVGGMWRKEQGAETEAASCAEIRSGEVADI